MEPLSPLVRWTSLTLTLLLVAFLAFDGVTKVLKVAPVLEASRKFGFGPWATQAIGLILLGCTTVYALPRTSVLGAILLTGYLGGAVAVHVVARSGVFPMVFSFLFGVLCWVPIALRNPPVVRLILGSPSAMCSSPQPGETKP